MPPLVDVSTEPDQDCPLQLESVPLLLGGNPAGGVHLFHGCPQGLGVVTEGRDVFGGHTGELAGDDIELLGVLGELGGTTEHALGRNCILNRESRVVLLCEDSFRFHCVLYFARCILFLRVLGLLSGFD